MVHQDPAGTARSRERSLGLPEARVEYAAVFQDLGALAGALVPVLHDHVQLARVDGKVACHLQKRLALGHKLDDHEEPVRGQQIMT